LILEAQEEAKDMRYMYGLKANPCLQATLVDDRALGGRPIG